MTQRSAIARRPLAAALFVALIAPGMAFAQTAKEKALEARVAELERQVQLLLSSQQQQQSQIATTQEQVTQVQAAQAAKPAVPAGKQPTKRDWERLSRSWRAELDARIATLESIRTRLTTCIGCGCLSLKTCGLLNPDDQAAASGPGARYFIR